jgi:hypothetical protein
MVSRSRKSYGALFLACVGITAGARATETGVSIGINFGTEVGGGGPSPTSSVIPAGGVAGAPAVQQTNWNDPAPGTGILESLKLDRAGTAETSPALVADSK